MFKKSVILAIKFYRRWISPLKRPSCRFYPTCSQYAIDAVNKYGAAKGILMSIKRLLKCHPFHPGGYDPVK
ncbi:membrane protein insertion efficiency factor YidD [Clostridium thermosuccinogenes]|uniref:Putative membrane protein insertion efficiency factor n=1 Tax=Clostridium thermosuccinogenes TaxID=84032 RepID=A0A2K2F956_9CLOT|nr:membrane protein insertion efficiency factor YidD [Pseudoclostridium thermosuccinogenes]AUS98500.1 membrane protein insertion efficiency factor YidD [Pseudoclostridium thermosuccinogenes]PNT90836.1 membrane protein insertion efficiency factor YidD [Pseudoclostridium thermosuccinogenes]PNT94752.1 membrane protein insertion efficiency factor YidD [Pseudoclostridium thermosuccinogenes]PNT95329.1 membrane protein insertion efficiency factor YidD [Pseudoclostridium thermosuccinogenes]